MTFFISLHVSTIQEESTTNDAEYQKWLREGQAYLDYGLSIIPIGTDKKPLFKWKHYQRRKASIREVQEWIKNDYFRGFAAVTGSISKVVVLDIDLGANVEGLYFPTTPVVRTGSGGHHHYFRYPKDENIKNYVGLRPKMDIRGSGGYVILPPAIHPNGSRYQWDVELKTPLADIPLWLRNELRSKTKETTNWEKSQVLKGVPVSQRNDSAAKVVGVFLHRFPAKEWETVAWPAIQGWNTQNQPPLDEQELRAVFDSIASREMEKRSSTATVRQIQGFEVNFTDMSVIEARKDDFSFRLQPKGKLYDVSLLKGNNIINRDRCSLVSSKARITFSNACMSLTEEEKSVVNRDLLQLTDVLDEINKEILKRKVTLSQEKELSEEEKDTTREKLRSPTLLYDIFQSAKRLGIAGEEKMILLHYLVVTSRITDEPLSVMVKGESSAGKSYVVSQILRLFPPDAYIDITDATAQSFFYAPEGHFAHKIIVIFERHGEEKADYSIRSLQSEKKLKIQVTVKDPDTGQFATKEHEVEGPAGFITTTTEAMVHQENETRHLSIYPDESEEQTGETFKATDAKYRGVQPTSEDYLESWRNIQRRLNPYPVYIPFVKDLRIAFPQKPVRVRRDYGKLLALLAVITILHQEQREKVLLNDSEYLKATLVDFHIAKLLLEETLQKTIYSIAPKSEQVIEAAKKLLPEDSLLPGVSIRDLASALDWDYDTVKKWFDPAFQKGYLIKTSEHSGSIPAKYKTADKALPSQALLPKTEDLYERNPDWLGGQKIYDPLTGTILEFQAKE